MREITFRGRVAALAGRVVVLAPHIEVLEPDHPERRFVSAMCVCSCEIDDGVVPGPFDQGAAERYARAAHARRGLRAYRALARRRARRAVRHPAGGDRAPAPGDP